MERDKELITRLTGVIRKNRGSNWNLYKDANEGVTNILFVEQLGVIVRLYWCDDDEIRIPMKKRIIKHYFTPF